MNDIEDQQNAASPQICGSGCLEKHPLVESPSDLRQENAEGYRPDAREELGSSKNMKGSSTRDTRRPKVFERDLRTRSALCGTGILLALVLAITHQPLILLAVPAGMIFLGIVADMQELLAAWFGMLNTVGIFDPSVLTDPERAIYAGRRDYFWFGEVASAAALAGVFTVPLGMSLAGRTGSLLSFIIAAMIFLLLFIFLPRLIRQAMKTDTETILNLFGKNEQFRKVFWTVFIALAGLIVAQVVDPVTAQEILRLITGMGG